MARKSLAGARLCWLGIEIAHNEVGRILKHLRRFALFGARICCVVLVVEAAAAHVHIEQLKIAEKVCAAKAALRRARVHFHH